MMFHRRNMDKNRPRFKTDKRFLIVVALAIVFTAAVLRAPITSMGALCVEVQDDLGLSSAAMGLVTTLPPLAFAASALFMDPPALLRWPVRSFLRHDPSRVRHLFRKRAATFGRA